MIKIDTINNTNTYKTPAYRGVKRWTEKDIQQRVLTIMSDAQVTGCAPSSNIFSGIANRAKDIAMIIKSGMVDDKAPVLNVIA